MQGLSARPRPGPAALRPLRPAPPRAPAPQPEELDLRAMLATLRHGWRSLALALALGLLAGAAWLLWLAVPVYTAEARIALESRTGQVLDIAAVMPGLTADQATVNTEVEVLRSRALLGRLAEGLGLAADPEFNPALRPVPALSPHRLLAFLAPPASGPGAEREAVIEALDRAISVSNLRQTYVFRIAARSEDPAKAARIANALAEAYLRDQLEVKSAATEQATGWLTGRVADLKLALEAAEAAVKDFDARSDLVSAEQLALRQAQLKDLRTRADLAGAAVREAGARLAATGPDITPAARAALQAEAGRARAEAAALRRSVADLTRSTERQAGDLVLLRQLQREAEASRLIYEHFLGRLKETSVQQGIHAPDARVLSAAVPPLRPSEPRAALVLGLCAAAALLISGSLVMLQERRQSGFRTVEALEGATGYPVLGQIPRLPETRRDRILDHILTRPASTGVEAIRNLRTSLLLSNIDDPPQVILSTSSVPGEGKTTQSLGLAVNLAGLGRRVLLVEGDLRRRVLSEYGTPAPAAGLVSLLTRQAGAAEAIRGDPRLGIDILMAERSRVNAADLYSSRAFSELIADLRRRYDSIVIDSPPVLVVSDARVIAQSADAVLYTVRWNSTPRAQVRLGLQMLESVGARIAGLVLSQVDPKGARRYGQEAYHGAGYSEEPA